LDGISFAPTLLKDGTQPTHDYMYWEFPAYGHQQAVRMGDWKAVRSGVNRRGSKFELYDLANDVAESRDVAAEHPDVVKRVQEIVATAHKPSRMFPLLAGEKRDK
jgi:arylsulfatase